jgi:hypothetical protein
MLGKVLEFRKPELAPRFSVLPERLVEMAILLENGELTLEQVQEEVLTWQD